MWHCKMAERQMLERGGLEYRFHFSRHPQPPPLPLPSLLLPLPPSCANSLQSQSVEHVIRGFRCGSHDTTRPEPRDSRILLRWRHPWDRLLGILPPSLLVPWLGSSLSLSWGAGHCFGFSSAERGQEILFDVVALLPRLLRHGDRIPLRDGRILQPKLVSEEPLPHF